MEVLIAARALQSAFAALLVPRLVAISVAPLRAIVLQAAERRHAGIASSVNNTVARISALLALAAVGPMVSGALGVGIEERLPGEAQARSPAPTCRRRAGALPRCRARRAAGDPRPGAVGERGGVPRGMVVAGC